MSESAKGNMNRKGKKLTEQGRKNVTEANRKKWEGHIPKPREVKPPKDWEKIGKKISASMKNTPHIECERCGASFTPQNYARWHGQKCTSDSLG